VKAVLDTSVVLAAGLTALDGELAISAATLAELHFGVLVADDAQRRAERLRRLAVLEHAFVPLPVDAHDARLYTRNAEDLRGLEGLVDVVAV
jgi:predicted nucleic acid-binding protein